MTLVYIKFVKSATGVDMQRRESEINFNIMALIIIYVYSNMYFPDFSSRRTAISSVPT